MSFGVNGFGSLNSNDLIQKMAGKGQTKKAQQPQKDTDSYIRAKKNDITGKTAGTENKVSLSDGAQKILDELKERYGDTDFYVADFANDEEAGQILSNSTKAYGVVIKPEELEKMAKDAEYKDKILQTIDDARTTLNDFNKSLSDEEKGAVKRVGFSMGDEGKVSFFAELEKAGKAQSERIRKMREEKAEEAKAEERKAEKEKPERRGEEKENPTVRSYVEADSIDELAEKLREFLEKDEDVSRMERPHIDFTA